ncbi:MAG: nucleotidyltransferase family protein [Candidatus Omnitrophica bacterium]|nr:nucleotidyltransferase family protein [Candidatus Omnitrophota bacterium]
MLKETFWLTAGFNLLLSQETGEILSDFKKQNIPVMILKGLTLAEFVYPHIGKRPMADIDLLVKKKDSRVVCERLGALGYTLKPGISGLSYIKEGPIPVCVDLRTEISYLKEEEIWNTARLITINEEAAHVLSIEQNIIYLCYHVAIGHGYPHQRWLEDIHRFITHHRGEIDWQEVIRKIQAYGFGIPCYWVLRRVKEVFQTVLPEEVLSSLKPAHSLKAYIFKFIFQSKTPIPFIDYLLEMLFYPRQYIFSRVFPTKEFLQIRYNVNSPVVYVYYILRPMFLVINGIKGLCRFIYKKCSY